jgi:hypothetical protein
MRKIDWLDFAVDVFLVGFVVFVLALIFIGPCNLRVWCA